MPPSPHARRAGWSAHPTAPPARRSGPCRASRACRLRRPAWKRSTSASCAPDAPRARRRRGSCTWREPIAADTGTAEGFQVAKSRFQIIRSFQRSLEMWNSGRSEAGTLRLLDILPASRQVVWAGKVSFAMGTTLALAGTLLAMAALGTDRWGPRPDVLAILDGLPLGAVVLQALGWGLFCSSIMGN